MAMPRTLRRWWRLPGRAALILGLGALSTAGARADTPEAHQRAGLGDLLIRCEGGRIYISEGGREFQELPLNDTAEAGHLRRLLEHSETAAGPAGLRLQQTILAGGGGMGFSWNPFAKTDPRAAGKADAREKPATPEKTGTSGKTDQRAPSKKE